MSKDKRDLPKTANENHGRNKPAKGELFVRKASGTVLLTQTVKTFLGGKKKS